MSRVHSLPRHVGRRQAADLGAVDVEGDAMCRRLHVFLFQAGSRAVIAGFSAGEAGVDAGFELLVGHEALLGVTAAPEQEMDANERRTMWSNLA